MGLGAFKISLNLDRFKPCPLAVCVSLDHYITILIAFNFGMISASLPYFLTLQLSRDTTISIVFIYTEFMIYSIVFDGSTDVETKHSYVSDSIET